MKYSEIGHIEQIFHKGDGIVTADTIQYRFFLTDGRTADAYFHHFGKNREEEIVSILREHVFVKDII